MTTTEQEDFKLLFKDLGANKASLTGKTFLITGATGLIGANLVRALLYGNEYCNLAATLILIVRNKERAIKLFGNHPKIIYMISDIRANFVVSQPVDYIVHAASQTSSKQFIEQPAETICTAYQGTKNILEIAHKNKNCKVVYLSSMEVYGTPQKGHIVTENETGCFNPMIVRNSYPISKLVSEALCKAYWSEYNVPTVVLRLTQTLGPGVKYNDGRVFAQFMRCAVEQRDIVLKTPGHTERCYLYTADAISAILVALSKGAPGEVYNVANSSTYCSIREMAELVAHTICQDKIKVIIEATTDVSKLGYANTLYMKLDTSKLNALGWQPHVGLENAYKRMIMNTCDKEK